MFNLKTLTAGAAALTMMASATFAETVIRVQSVLGNSTDEVRMVESFAQDVFDLTNGSVKIEILPAGAVVGPRDIIDAVDAGLVEAGFAWTHYWGGKHPAANLFGAPYLYVCKFYIEYKIVICQKYKLLTFKFCFNRNVVRCISFKL